MYFRRSSSFARLRRCVSSGDEFHLCCSRPARISREAVIRETTGQSNEPFFPSAEIVIFSSRERFQRKCIKLKNIGDCFCVWMQHEIECSYIYKMTHQNGQTLAGFFPFSARNADPSPVWLANHQLPARRFGGACQFECPPDTYKLF